MMLEFELLLIALGARTSLSASHTDEEWEAALDFAERQAITGILYDAIERLPKSQMPSMELILRWLGRVETLRTRNLEMDQNCTQAAARFREAGFDCVVLKGQGVAQLYPESLVRTSGDIDIWIRAEREQICRYLREHIRSYDPRHEGDLHTSFHWRGTTVEVHFTPTYLTCPGYAKRLQQWLSEVTVVDADSTSPFPVPTREFNLVYLLLHMYRHYLFEGIGLRHVIDYYIVWSQASDDERAEAMATLESLGVKPFAAALMWVMERELRLLPSSPACCPPDRWRGRMLMSAILRGGNFGQADRRNSHRYRTWGWRRLIRFVSRNTRLLCAYPQEIGWHIIMRICGSRLRQSVSVCAAPGMNT